MKCAH